MEFLSKQKIEPFNERLKFFDLRSCNKVRTEATGANIHTLMCSVHNSLNLSDIGLPSAVCLSVRVRNLKTKGNALSTDLAFCHFADTSYHKAVLQNGVRFFINIGNYNTRLEINQVVITNLFIFFERLLISVEHTDKIIHIASDVAVC